MNGENAGVIGESWGFALQKVWGASEVGFEPGDTLGAIQLVDPWPYSKFREVVTTKSNQTSNLDVGSEITFLFWGETFSPLALHLWSSKILNGGHVKMVRERNSSWEVR